MELSGLNKALHSLYSRKILGENQGNTRQEIVSSINAILGKIKEFDQDKAIVFETVTDTVVQCLTSQHYEVYAILKRLEDMVEVVDVLKEGFSRLEIAIGNFPYDVVGPWFKYLDNDGFMERPPIHQCMKKLGYQAITDLHSQQLLGSVRVAEEDLNSSKFRFQLSSKFHGNIVVYVIPAVEIKIRPRSLRTDIPLGLKKANVLFTSNGCWGSEVGDPRRTLWQVSLLAIENEVFSHLDGMPSLVRALLHLLCEKYVHYPVTCQVVDVLFEWNLCAHSSQEDWSYEGLAARVLEILENLRRALRNHRVRNYFMPEYNMLAEVDGLKLDKAAERVLCLMQRLKENPHKLELFA